jgi:HK97 family phage prohead protease
VTETVERRAIVGELRARRRRLEGYAAVFDSAAQIRDYTETILPGAFRHSLAADKDILAMVDHDPGRVLARTRSKTLRLSEDMRGLHFDLDLPATSYANDILALVESNNAGGMSFAFIPLDERWDGDRRELRSVDLKEISVIAATPAYPSTLVEARARPVFYPRLAVARRYLESL